MANRYQITTLNESQVIAKNNTLKNTYLLLSLTLMFSALTATISVFTNAPYPGLLPVIAGTYGLMFLTHVLQNSVWGLAAVFAFTGFIGYCLGPLLNSVLTLSNGGTIIMMSLGATGIVFLGLSGHVLTSRKDYSYLGGFLVIGLITILLGMLAAILFRIPALHLAVSGAFTLLASGMILFQTSQIINGGERNYIIATISLYVSIYNLFVSLLHIFSSFAGNNRD